MQENLSAFFTDFATQAQYEGSLYNVIFESPDHFAFVEPGTVIAAAYSILYRTGDLDGLADGDSIVIDGHTYQVTEGPRAVDDGKVTRALLMRTD